MCTRLVLQRQRSLRIAFVLFAFNRQEADLTSSRAFKRVYIVLAWTWSCQRIVRLIAFYYVGLHVSCFTLELSLVDWVFPG